MLALETTDLVFGVGVRVGVGVEERMVFDRNVSKRRCGIAKNRKYK